MKTQDQSDQMDFHRILYTGASGGLGFETTLRFLERGALVAAVDHNQGSLDKLAVASADLPGKLMCLKADLQDTDRLGEALASLSEEAGGFTTLINNAAIYPSKPAQDYSVAEFRSVLQVNVEAAFVCMKAVVPAMKSAGWGRILNVSSNTVSGGWSNLSPYVASKAALIGMTRTWAREFGALGITVNAIAPGAFPTDAEKIHSDQEAYQQSIIFNQAIKRRGQIGELAAVMEFLLSHDAAFITGQTINVDGGWVMR